jgi:hypothetical protein
MEFDKNFMISSILLGFYNQTVRVDSAIWYSSQKVSSSTSDDIYFAARNSSYLHMSIWWAHIAQTKRGRALASTQ